MLVLVTWVVWVLLELGLMVPYAGGVELDSGVLELDIGAVEVDAGPVELGPGVVVDT